MSKSQRMQSSFYRMTYYRPFSGTLAIGAHVIGAIVFNRLILIVFSTAIGDKDYDGF